MSKFFILLGRNLWYAFYIKIPVSYFMSAFYSGLFINQNVCMVIHGGFASHTNCLFFKVKQLFFLLSCVPA